MGPLEIVFAVIGVLLVGILCFFAGTYYRKRVGEREIGSAEQEATRIINLDDLQFGRNYKRGE